jgi:hypothetical protein
MCKSLLNKIASHVVLGSMATVHAAIRDAERNQPQKSVIDSAWFKTSKERHRHAMRAHRST